MAVQLRSDEALKKEIFDTISKQSPTEMGNLIFSMYSEMSALTKEIGIDQTNANKETGLIDYEYKTEEKKEDDVVPKNEYEKLLDEYKSRFSGNLNKNNPTPEPERDNPQSKNEPFTLDIFNKEE